jgi:hypothetical protein
MSYINKKVKVESQKNAKTAKIENVSSSILLTLFTDNNGKPRPQHRL